MILRTILAVACATGRASHARQVKDDDPDRKGYPGFPAWGLGVGITSLHKKTLLRNPKEMKLDGYLGNDIRQYTKVEDARKLDCRNWLTAAQDGSRWRHLLEKAKDHLGL
jgi:hypothetical protein